MIVICLLLVIAAAVSLALGVFVSPFKNTNTWIYVSIGASLLASVFLFAGVMQRNRQRRRAPVEPGYGPGAAGPFQPTPPPVSPPPVTEPAADVTVVPKRTAPTTETAPAADAEEAAPAAAAGDEAAGTALPDAVAAAAGGGASARTTKTPAARSRATTGAAATKSTAAKATASRSTRRTTGDAAKAELAKVKGVGPAKQDALLKAFGSLEAIRDAPVERLAQVPGIGAGTAGEIKRSLSA